MFQSQGARANKSGNIFEGKVSAHLDSLKEEYVRQYSYEPFGGGRKRRADFYLPSDKTIVEAKNQDVPGTADQKLENEIWTAYETFHDNPDVERYIIVLGGKHWQKESQAYKIERARRLAEKLTVESEGIVISVTPFESFKERH